jgi:hypothetical protein
MSKENSSDNFGNRNFDLPACSAMHLLVRSKYCYSDTRIELNNAVNLLKPTGYVMHQQV